MMSGSLGEWSVEDLLQIAKITHKSASIDLVGERFAGAVYLRDGAVVDAEVFGQPATGGDRFSRIVEAIGRLVGIEDGTFEFGTRDLPRPPERPIETKAIFAAIEKDLFREKRLTDLGVSSGEGLALNRHIGDQLSLKPAAWQLIADLVEPFSIDALEARVGRRKAVATILTLEALGVLKRNAEILAGDWTDQAPVINDDGWADIADEDSRIDPAPDEAGDDADDPNVEGVQDSDSTDQEAGWGTESSAEWPVVEQHSEPDEVDDPVTSEDALISSEPVVEIFGIGPMHEVVAPSDTTLVTGVLGDMKSRFRVNRRHVSDFEDPSG